MCGAYELFRCWAIFLSKFIRETHTWKGIRYFQFAEKNISTNNKNKLIIIIMIINNNKNNINVLLQIMKSTKKLSWNFILLSIWQYVFRFVDVIVSWKEYTLSAQMQAILWIIVVTKLTNIQSCRAVSRNIDTFTQSSKTHLALAGVGTLSLKLKHGPLFLLKHRQRSLLSVFIYCFFCRSWLVWYELNPVHCPKVEKMLCC